MRDRRARGYSSASTSRTHTLRWGSRAYSSTLSSSRTSACTPPLANSSVVVCPALVSSPHFAVVYGSKRFHGCAAQLRHQHGMICNWSKPSDVPFESLIRYCQEQASLYRSAHHG